jgi:hypothetical protein
MTATDTRGQIVDAREEKVYDLDMRKKSYTVTTFAELRRKMEEMEAKAKEDASKAPADEKPDTQGKEMQIDVDVKTTGQAKPINGFDTHQVIMTITGHEKGKTLEDSGGFVLTVDDWLTKTQPALREIGDFERRYYEKLAGPQIQMDAKQLATALAMMPGLKDAFTKANMQKLDGTPIQSTMTVEGVKSADQMKTQQSSTSSSGSDSPASVSGIVGGFMRKRAQANAEKNPPSARSMFMTITNEVLTISTSVSAADVAIPAGFKQEK